MTSCLSVIFISTCTAAIIFNLPTSHGIYNPQGYHVSTISRVLTLPERFNYALTGSLPSRIQYSYEKGCYVVTEQGVHYKNDLRRKKGKRYKTVPRWQYYLSKLSPASLIKSGMEYVSISKALLGLGEGFLHFDHGGGDLEGGDGDGDGDGGADGDGKNDEKGPGLLSKGMDYLMPVLNYFGKSDGNNSEKQDDKKDEKKDDKKDEENPAEGTDYAGMAKDALQSDVTKAAVKLAIGALVPGGPAIVTAMEAGEKMAKADDAVDKVVPDKLKLK